MKKQIGPDVTELVAKMQERMVILERKIDILISRVPARQFDAKPQQHFQPKPQGDGNRQQQPPQQQSQQNQQPPRKDKVMHKAICADCKKDCEVPFVPTENRPVYCKECYSKRRSGIRPINNDNKSNIHAPRSAVIPAAPVPIAAKKASSKKSVVKKAKTEKKKAAPKKKKKI